MDESKQCSSLSSSETPGQQTDVTTYASQSISCETPWKTACVTPLIDESHTSLFPSEMPSWKEGDVTQLVDHSVPPSLYPSNTPYKVDHVSSLADQSSSPFLSETPWKLVDVIPSLNQPEAVFPQRYRFSLMPIRFRRFRGIFCLLLAVSQSIARCEKQIGEWNKTFSFANAPDDRGFHSCKQNENSVSSGVVCMLKSEGAEGMKFIQISGATLNRMC